MTDDRASLYERSRTAPTPEERTEAHRAYLAACVAEAERQIDATLERHKLDGRAETGTRYVLGDLPEQPPEGVSDWVVRHWGEDDLKKRPLMQVSFFPSGNVMTVLTTNEPVLHTDPEARAGVWELMRSLDKAPDTRARRIA